MDIGVIGGALTAVALLATTITTFFSRRSDQLRKDYTEALAELGRVNRDLDESDRKNYLYRRALIRNGIPVPGEEPDDDRDPRGPGPRARRQSGPTPARPARRRYRDDVG